MRKYWEVKELPCLEGKGLLLNVLAQYNTSAMCSKDSYLSGLIKMTLILCSFIFNYHVDCGGETSKDTRSAEYTNSSSSCVLVPNLIN